MSLEPGMRFGAYEIVGQLGAGGMGEVYRAHDTALERDVAIKVLPASFANDSGRVERFEREAKTLAALNHANIAQIYGLEKSDGTTALVMELVEGPTLEDRIASGPIPADEALNIAMQIADALEAAHGQSIVHRDLKPANIKLRADGLVKVLDFGIAKALQPENLVSGPQSPVMTTPATQVGVILGTAAYMSPEQARGKGVDQRTDIWAFGCVLYEMLTGQLAFGAEDVPTTLARVIANDTSLDSLPASIPPAVRHTIHLCLRKDPRKRVADIRDVRLALAGEFEAESPVGAAALAPRPPLWQRALPVAAAVLVTAVIVGFGIRQRMQPEPPVVSRFELVLPAGQTMRSDRRAVAVSADGRAFAYSTTSGIYLRTLDDLTPRLVPGTDRGTTRSPVFSPDGRSLAYHTLSGEIQRIAVGGGAPTVIASVGVSSPYGLAWSTDGTLIYSTNSGIYRVAAIGGTPELVVRVDNVNNEYFAPQLLPDGDSLLFAFGSVGGANIDTAQIAVQSLTTGERTVLVPGGNEPRYLPTGHLVYVTGDTLVAVPFDFSHRAVSGAPVPIVQGIARATAQGGNVVLATGQYDIADNGTLVYVRAGNASTFETTLVWVDRQGREQPIDMPPRRNYTYPRISPDGTRVALDIRDQEIDIWVWDLARETLARLTFDPGQDRFSAWSPDSRRIAFSTTRDRRSDSQTNTSLYVRAADGTGVPERLAEGVGQLFPQAFTPDGTGILISGAIKGGAEDDDIALYHLAGGEQSLTPLLQTTFIERNPELSPDGRWLAYSSNESGTPQIYVRPFPDVDAGRWQISTDGGVQPLWQRNGRELFYRNGDAMIAVPVETSPTFAAGAPTTVFEGPYVLGPGGRTYDVSPDGERFLMTREIATPGSEQKIVVVQNWFEELKRLVPTE